MRTCHTIHSMENACERVYQSNADQGRNRNAFPTTNTKYGYFFQQKRLTTSCKGRLAKHGHCAT